VQDASSSFLCLLLKLQRRKRLQCRGSFSGAEKCGPLLERPLLGSIGGCVGSPSDDCFRFLVVTDPFDKNRASRVHVLGFASLGDFAVVEEGMEPFGWMS
jgi:hypothetical protein